MIDMEMFVPAEEEEEGEEYDEEVKGEEEENFSGPGIRAKSLEMEPLEAEERPPQKPSTEEAAQ